MTQMKCRLIHQQMSLPSGNKIINNGIKNDDFEQSSGHVCVASFKNRKRGIFVENSSLEYGRSVKILQMYSQN